MWMLPKNVYRRWVYTSICRPFPHKNPSQADQTWTKWRWVAQGEKPNSNKKNKITIYIYKENNDIFNFPQECPDGSDCSTSSTEEQKWSTEESQGDEQNTMYINLKKEKKMSSSSNMSRPRFVHVCDWWVSFLCTLNQTLNLQPNHNAELKLKCSTSHM